MRARVEELLRGTGRRSRAAIVAAVRREDEVVVATWAPRGVVAGADAVFEIGSLTKPFTGILLAAMQTRGEVALDDPLGRHLPAAASLGGGLEAVTLEQLATHRSGLPNTPRGMLPAELAILAGLRRDDPWAGVDTARHHELVRATRRGMPTRLRPLRYSSLGFGLLGDALAARAGLPYGELLRERVLAPLGMTSTGLDVDVTLPGGSRRGRSRPPLRDPMPAAGALRSSANDVLRWLDACLMPPPGELGRALTVAARPRVRANRRMAFGLGWMVLEPRRGPRTVWHNGGTYGFRSFGAFVPDRGVAVVVLTNASRDVTALGHALVRAAIDER